MPSFVLLFFVLGLAMGSFGNVLLFRMRRKTSILGRSRCRTCHRTLHAIDLIPVLSYVFLGGRCRRCGKSISVQYPLVELVSAVLFGLAAVLFPGEPIVALATAFLFYSLFLTTLFDHFYQQLPDVFTLLIGLFAAIITLLVGDILSSLEGALLGFVWFGVQWLVSRRRAVGSGDIFLATALGLWLGLPGTILMLFFSYVVGAIVVLILLGLGVIQLGKKRIAFGPFLAIGALLSFFGVGYQYLELIGF